MRKKSSAFIRSKTVKGRVYWYLVSAFRVDGKPHQKVIGYLGDQRPDSVPHAYRIMRERANLVLDKKNEAMALEQLGTENEVQLLRRFRSTTTGMSGRELNNERRKILLQIIARVEWRFAMAIMPARKANRRETRRIIQQARRLLKLWEDFPLWYSREVERQFPEELEAAASFDPRVLPDPGR